MAPARDPAECQGLAAEDAEAAPCVQLLAGEAGIRPEGRRARQARWAGLAAAGLLAAAFAAVTAGSLRPQLAPAPAAANLGEDLELVLLKSTGKNPFKDVTYYVNPLNRKRYEHSMKSAKSKRVRKNLEAMSKVGSAWWIDKKSKIHGDTTETVEGILKDAKEQDPVPLVTLIWYDMPNRDCDAKASVGEICCTKKHGHCDYDHKSNCTEGIKEYKEEYVDPFVKVLKKYSDDVPVVIILEPDSLANLATNTGHPHCGNPATVAAYRIGFKYALDQLVKEVPKVKVYIDAAHGAWLGWGHNIEDFLEILRNMSLPMKKVRGFATNVAKYQPLGVRCPWEPDAGFLRNAYCLPSSHGNKQEHAKHPCCEDQCGLLDVWNSANNELNYAALLIRASRKKFGMDYKAVVDTGRNGVQKRKDCNNFCNIRNAGTGIASTSDTEDPGMIDAYFWLKTPGESDGCTEKLPSGENCSRYDAVCGSEDSLGNEEDEPRAPEAGMWYDYQVKQLAELARMKLDASDD